MSYEQRKQPKSQSNKFAKKLAFPDYFDKVCRKMKASGFHLISRVQIDSDDASYHVPATYVRKISLFFRFGEQSIIVQMNCNEYDYPEGMFQAYWTLELYVQYLHERALSDIIVAKRKNQTILDLDLDDEFAIPLYDYPLDIKGFRQSGSMCGPEGNFMQCHQSYDQENTRGQLPRAEELEKNISAVITQIIPYSSKFFRELQVTSFWPHYTFPKSAPIFWKRFDLKKLKEFVHEPWGGDIPKEIS